MVDFKSLQDFCDICYFISKIFQCHEKFFKPSSKDIENWESIWEATNFLK